MQFQPQFDEYLKGERFDNGIRVPIASGVGSIPGRVDYLAALVAGRNVIHVGCLDHLPLIEKKIERGTWLHGRLTKSAARCLGIDIDREGLAFVRDKIGYPNVLYCNVIEDEVPQEVRSERWDMMVLGEVLEHIDNPVQFLTAIQRKYAPFVEQLVVTVPNAFRIENFFSASRGKEWISSDHRYWFTPYTLAKVFVRSGFSSPEFIMSQSYPIPGVYLPKRLLLQVMPALRDTIIMTARF